MIIPEHIAKTYLARYGLAVPRGGAASTPAEARDQAASLGGEVVVKALIPSGKRGEAGGVLFAATPDECERAAARLLGSQLLGFPVDQVLVEEKARVAHETLRGLHGRPLQRQASAPLECGRRHGRRAPAPAAIHKLVLAPDKALPLHRMARALRGSGIDESLAGPLARVMTTLHAMLLDLDLMQIEVNPLALLNDGSLLALDCKMEADDNAFGRQPEFAELHRAGLRESEVRAARLGVSFVPLEGEIGVIASGAGLGMATLDLLRRAGLRPADFLDTGGGITTDLMRGAVELVGEPATVTGLIINLYGGINPMIAAAEGIAGAVRAAAWRKPVVVKLLGNSQEEAWRILEEAGVAVVKVPQTEAAVDRLMTMLRGKNGDPA